MKNSNKKNLLLIIMLICIIVVLFVGIVYQFIIIKSLQREISSLSVFKIIFKNL